MEKSSWGLCDEKRKFWKLFEERRRFSLLTKTEKSWRFTGIPYRIELNSFIFLAYSRKPFISLITLYAIKCMVSHLKTLGIQFCSVIFVIGICRWLKRLDGDYQWQLKNQILYISAPLIQVQRIGTVGMIVVWLVEWKVAKAILFAFEIDDEVKKIWFTRVKSLGFRCRRCTSSCQKLQAHKQIYDINEVDMAVRKECRYLLTTWILVYALVIINNVKEYKVLLLLLFRLKY